jgi:hypothetical protein
MIKTHATKDLMAVVGGMPGTKGDFVKGEKTYRVGKSSTIRVGDVVEVGGSPVDPLEGLC